jgi:hypothetical protein
VADTETAVLEQSVALAKEVAMAPAPVATGNELVAVLDHSIYIFKDEWDKWVYGKGVELVLRNVSTSVIVTAVFEAVFFDQEGNVINTKRHQETEFLPDTSRRIDIVSTLSRKECVKIESYDVKLIRTTTTETQKVLLVRHELATVETGEEEVRGIVKNLSDEKADAAVVATFYDVKTENLGTRVLSLRDIAPHTIRQYVLRFKPQKGERVSSCNIAVGEIVD